jgi:hypothetical protein
MRRYSQVVSLVAVLGLAGLLCAQTSSGKPDEKASPATRGAAKKEGKAKASLAVTPEREAAVMTFVQRNHAELADLLARLKTSQPHEYERAVREIFRTTERLALIQERDPLQYELEIAVWTAQSRVQLLAARLKMAATDELTKQLREALSAQAEAKLVLLKHERQRIADRLSKVERELAQFENDRDQVIDKQLQLLTRSAAEGRTAKVGTKNAVKQAKKAPAQTSPPVSQP